MQKKLNLIKDQLPVVYRYNSLVRWGLIAVSFLTIIYSLYFLLVHVTSDTGMFFKVVPLVIIFVGLDSILRKITSLNSIKFTDEGVFLGFLARRNIYIPYADIIGIDLSKKLTYYLIITYRDNKGIKQFFKTPASFPHILEIILNLADLSPSVTYTSQMEGILQHLKDRTNDDV